MTEPVQVNTAAQYGYKHPAIYSHFIVKFLSKNTLIGRKCKKEAAPNSVLLPFCIYDNLLDCLRNIPLFNFRNAQFIQIVTQTVNLGVTIREYLYNFPTITAIIHDVFCHFFF